MVKNFGSKKFGVKAAAKDGQKNFGKHCQSLIITVK